MASHPNRRALWILTAIWVPLLVAGLVLDSLILDGLTFLVVGFECAVYNRDVGTSRQLIGPFKVRRVESVVLGVLTFCLGVVALVAGIAG